ncbi:hypothetical protein Tco_0877802 [Tanacetum coccineum]|uniref:Uncharacterized protein n=1 Tax=Tanacetum coccineum TaxID=301880 RepID=A0ABQ5BYU9_9ASTR
MTSRPRIHIPSRPRLGITTALAIANSSDSSDKSVGSPPSRVILFGDIPTVIPSTSVVAPETSTIAPVISDSAPVDEISSPEHISPLPDISPFLCIDSSEAPDSSDGPPSQDPYVATVARWRSRVTASPLSSSEFPIAPVTASPRIRRWSAILIRPGEAIPFGRPYRTHLSRPRLGIMATSAIVISSDSSDKSVGSPPSRVILFCNILTVIPSTSVVAPESSTIAPIISSAAPVVETTLVASPTGMCGLVPYSGFDSDSPEEMSSPEHISPLPAISPFLCTDSFKAPDSSDGPPSQDPYVATVARWRSREAIPFGRPYRTHLNGPRKLLTVRKRVGPLPTRRLACRHALPRSSNHRSSSSNSSLDSSPVHSSGLDASDQAHSGSSTRGVPPRLCYPPRRAPRRSEAFRRWCAAPLFTLSSVDFVPSSTPVMGSLAPTRADLLPPRKMFRDSYSSEASIEEDIEIDPIETEVDIELGIGVRDDVRDHVEIDPRDVRDDTKEYEDDTSVGDTVEVGIDLMSAPIVEEEIVEPAGEDSSDLSGTRDGIVRSFEDIPIDLYDVVRDFYHHMSEVRIDRIVEIETAQRRLEADQLIVRGQRVSMIERIDSLRLENLKVRAMLDIERDRMSSLRLHVSFTGGVLSGS